VRVHELGWKETVLLIKAKHWGSKKRKMQLWKKEEKEEFFGACRQTGERVKVGKIHGKIAELGGSQVPHDEIS